MAAQVLIIEDNLIQQRVYTILCERLQVGASVTASCSEACSWLRDSQNRFDVVLLDWCLPDGECGLNWITEIKQIAANQGRSIAVIIVTGHTSESERKEALNRGADDFLGKPFSIDEFSHIVQTWLGRMADGDGLSARITA